MASATSDRPRLVVHVVQRLDPGGADVALPDLLRHMPPGRYRHAVLCLADGPDTLRSHDVEVIRLGKRDGKDFGHYLRMFRVLRALNPDLVHTRNLCGLEGQLVAALAGVKLRVHGEHASEEPGAAIARLRYRLLRRMLRPLIGHFIAATTELAQWLVESVGAQPGRVSRIPNGVDSVQFHPRLAPAAAIGPGGFMTDDAFVIGSCGPMDADGNHELLVDAFLELLARPGCGARTPRLLVVGDGPARAHCLARLARAGQAHRAWLPGARPDLARLMRLMDVYVDPADGEGRGGAILQAMASGLPVVASDAGINAELIGAGFSGALVGPMDAASLAMAIGAYLRSPALAQRHGARARAQVLANHSLPAMARGYLAVYDALAARARAPDHAV